VSGAAAVGKLVEGAAEGTRDVGTAEEYTEGDFVGLVLLAG